MKTWTKLLCMALAMVMCFGIVACSNTDQPTGDEETTEASKSGKTVDMEAYGKTSKELYDQILGGFYTAYQKALNEKDNVSLRYAYMAIAEAKLLEAGVMLPNSSQGGNYAIGRVVPYTVSSVLWGNDSDRFYKILITNTPITSKDRKELKNKYQAAETAEDYYAAAKAYLNEKGYTLKDTYSMVYSSDPETWDALATSLSADSEAIVNTYDGLYEYDAKNVQQPALALSHTVSGDGLTYTFTLRQGVKWVDSQGREQGEVKAGDFVAGMQHLLDAQGGLETLLSGVIVGVDDYLDGKITDFSKVGVKAVNDYTLQYTLVEKTPYFTTMLGYGMFAPLCKSYYESKGGKFGAAFDAAAKDYTYGKTPNDIAYCGPFVVTSNVAENSIVFAKNESYWNKDNVTIKTLTWRFNDGKDATKTYKDMKNDTLDGAGLNASSVALAKAEKVSGTDKSWFDTYSYVTGTDATAYMAFININRDQYVNVKDWTGAASTMTDAQKERTNKALLNQHFRTALMYSLDRAEYNAQTVGDDLKYASLINSYTPGNFVKLEEAVTIKINGEDKTYDAGTFYGEIMQDQITADGYKYKVWDPTGGADGLGSSAGFDGWLNLEEATKELEAAIKELGMEITKENPIYLDLPCFSGSEAYKNRANAFKKSVETAFDGKIIMNLVECPKSGDWYNAGYYPNYGYEMNYSIYDVSGWGPDYGDPSSYLDTFLPEYMGYMTKCLGIY